MIYAQLLLVGSAAAFSPAGVAMPMNVQTRASTPLCVEGGRRAALFNGAALASGAVALAALPREALAGSIEDIAAKANAKAVAEREAAAAKIDSKEDEVSTEEKLKPIITAVGASVVLSVPFYYQNLQRLFTKVSTGGADSGYSKKGGRKTAKKAKKPDGKNVAKQLAMSAFKVKL